MKVQIDKKTQMESILKFSLHNLIEKHWRSNEMVLTHKWENLIECRQSSIKLKV